MNFFLIRKLERKRDIGLQNAKGYKLASVRKYFMTENDYYWPHIRVRSNKNDKKISQNL